LATIKEKEEIQTVALKLSKLEDEYSFDDLVNEADIQRALMEANISQIVPLVSAFWEPELKKVVFVMPPAIGDLLSIDLEEDDVRKTFATIAEGVNAIHDAGVAHCDLKLQNILVYQTKDDYTIVKIADFGGATRMENGKFEVTERSTYSAPYGSPEYKQAKIAVQNGKAAELMDGGLVDSYALGVLLYKLVIFADDHDMREHNGRVVPHPSKFEGKTDQAFYDEEGNAKEVLDLTENLLKGDPTKRYNVEQARKHPYFLQPSFVSKDDEKKA